MSDLDKLDPKVQRQYTEAYGPFTSGEYPIGSAIQAPGIAGEIIWSYCPVGGPLTYVVDPGNGDFPVEVQANEVRQAK